MRADLSCLATDPVTPVSEGYDPAVVDWNAVVGDLEAVWDVEPRFCSFAIRAWFHDIGECSAIAFLYDLLHEIV